MTHPRKEGQPWSDREKLELQMLANNGWVIDELAQRFGRSHSSIATRLKRQGLPANTLRPEERGPNRQGRQRECRPECVSDDDAHVQQVLSAGYFVRLPISWRDPMKTQRFA